MDNSVVLTPTRDLGILKNMDNSVVLTPTRDLMI